MQIDLATQLPCSLTEVIAQVRTPRLLRQVASPLLSFSPLTPTEFPSTWSEGTYWVRLKLFGVLPIGHQAIVISYPQGEIEHGAPGYAQRGALCRAACWAD